MLLFVIKHYLLKQRVNFNLPYANHLQNEMSRWISQPGKAHKYYILGFLNGLLPCGLVYIALGTAALSGSMQGSALVMLGFGLGTAPALIALVLFKQKLKAHWSFKRWVPLVVGLTSVLMVLRGLDLGIPYISPKLNVSSGSIENCCSK